MGNWPYRYRPVNKKGGKPFFAKYVRHPGVKPKYYARGVSEKLANTPLEIDFSAFNLSGVKADFLAAVLDAIFSLGKNGISLMQSAVPVDTGLLKRSLVLSQTKDGADLGVVGEAEIYAPMQELGTAGTYIIKPVTVKALAFVWQRIG